ncbi:MAG TPA: hypothetical protein DCY25_02420 [Bacteroidales bacterium]|nr:hypothetical protein [Bacteroidales bacterium]
MKFLKQYRIILAVFLLVLILVLIRTISPGRFKYDAVKWAEPSATGSNIINEAQLDAMTGKKLLVDLGSEPVSDSRFGNITVRLDPGSILDKTNLKLIRKNRGPVVLYSEDISEVARIWMILSEMGVKDLYILSESADEK